MYNVPLLDDKLNDNNTIFQASLINLSSLIQKILEENKKNLEKNMSDFSSSNSIILKDYSIQNKTNKNKEANKKIIDLKKNYADRNNKNATPNKTITDRNIHISTLATIKGLMTNNNFHNYVGNAIEKSSSTQDEKNSKSIDQSEFIEDTNKIKEKKKNNKTLSSFDRRKNIYNIFDNKREKDKLINNNKGGSALNKLKSNKIAKDKERNISRKEIITTPDFSKIKEEKMSKSNKLLKTVAHSNNTINRKSYQYLNINTNTSTISKNKNTSKNNQKKSLTHYGTKTDLVVNKKQNNNATNTSNTSNTKVNNKEEQLKKLSVREKSYYALSNSPILRLKERLLFGRSTQNLRNIQPVSDILKRNEIFLNDKIKELEEKMAECDKRINSTFTASKTAEINFNFILTKDEDEFKSFLWLAENEKEKSEYYIYLKIIYLVFNENYENIELKHLSEKLYGLVNKKGYKTLKEYLYYLYFKKKDNNMDNNIIYNIDKINDLLGEKQFDNNFNVKFCRFALFTSFLIKEVIKYGNEIKNMMQLKVKTKELIDVINNKLKLYKEGNSSKKN